MPDDQSQAEYWEQDHGHRGHDHPVVRTFAQQRIEFIRRFVDLSQVRTALDVGCGNGFSTFYMRRHVPTIWAIDRSHYMLARHPLRAESRMLAADALKIPLRDDQFDLVYAWEVLHHISEPVRVVRELARLSRKYVVMAEPNPLNPAQLGFALYDPEHRWVLRFTRGYMRRLAEESGLEVMHCVSGGWIFPNMTPRWLTPALRLMPYRFPLGISNWVFARKR